MSPRLKTLAKQINGMPGYSARIEKGYCNTDRNIRGTRLRLPGKGRYGNRIIVKKDGIVVLDHNAAETYRQNWEVVDWIRKESDNLVNEKLKNFQEKFLQDMKDPDPEFSRTVTENLWDLI